SAVAYANMSPVVSQCVDLRFFCGTEHTAMNAQSFDNLGGELQDAVMEASYLTQVHVQAANEAALVNTVGFSHPHQGPDTIFAKNNVKVAALSDAEIKKAEEQCSPEFQPQLWEQWRERINGWAGGIDTYQEIYDTVREHDITLAENVEPRRWWKG
ncbi:MAG: TRAP transporter substrate-binding protein DctP, partial [Pseudomonadota bacterium]